MIHFVLFLLATCQSVVAVKNPACSSGVYSKLASYSSIEPVSSFCLSLYRPQTQTSIVSTTTTITTTSTLTTTATTDTTTFVPSTITDSVTVTLAPPAKVKRLDDRAVKSSTTPTQPCPELVALKALASNVVATACSCIISTPTVTLTRTATLIISAQATSTATATNVITSTTTTTTTSTSTTTASPPPPLETAPGCLNPSAVGCSSGVPCGGGNSGSCICEQTTEGRNVCVDEAGISCGATCTSSAQCGNGYSCVTSTCCPGSGTCLRSLLSVGNTCTNVAAKMVRMLRGHTDKRAVTIGYPLHLPPTST